MGGLVRSAANHSRRASALSAARQRSAEAGGEAAATEARLAAMPNPNRPSHFQWLGGLLEQIAQGESAAVTDVASGRRGSPLFVVAGACPSVFAGMQAVMYVAMAAEGGGAAAVDFWWVKPQAAAPTRLEAATLDRHVRGAHKNDPCKSRQVYAPLAEMFGASVAEGEMRFGLEEEGGVGARAYLEEGGQRCYLLLVWQEAWTSNPFARSKFLKGKLLYQRDEPHAPTFHACPFAITDGVVSVSFEAEEEVPTALPPDVFKLGNYV